MGIYLPNVYMPKDDKVLTIQICPDGSIWQQYRGTVPNAKAVIVPPHYDLIDHNALKIAVMDCDAETRIGFLKHAMDCINKAPVVIPSDMPTYEAEEG